MINLSVDVLMDIHNHVEDSGNGDALFLDVIQSAFDIPNVLESGGGETIEDIGKVLEMFKKHCGIHAADNSMGHPLRVFSTQMYVKYKERKKMMKKR